MSPVYVMKTEVWLTSWADSNGIFEKQVTSGPVVKARDSEPNDPVFSSHHSLYEKVLVNIR